VVYTRMHTFTEYSSLDSNNNKKDISLDGCFYPMGGTSGSNFDAFAYNLCTNTKGPTFTCTTSQADHFTSGMVHSNRMWVGWGSATGTSQCVGEWLYDTSMSPVQQLFTNAPHSTGVYDPVANKEYILYSGGLNHHVCNGGGSSEIATVDLQNFTYTCLVPVPFSVGNIHETSNNPNGWWGYEITDSGNTANDNSTLAANWQNSWGHSYNEIGIGNISTGKIYRLAHSRTRTGGTSPCGGYFTQTRPSMSLDGTHIAFVGGAGIRIANADGTGAHTVADTDDAGHDLAGDAEAEVGLVAGAHDADEFAAGIVRLEGDALHLHGTLRHGGGRIGLVLTGGEQRKESDGDQGSDPGERQAHGSISFTDG